MTARENLEFVQAAVAAYGRGDVETVLAMFDPEVETMASRELLNPGTYRGRDGFLTWAAEWLDAFADWQQEVWNYEAIGDRHVVADARQSGLGKASGVPIEMHLAYMWEMRDGAAVRFHVYLNRADAEEAARRGEAEGRE